MKLPAQNVQEATTGKLDGPELQGRKGSSTYRVLTHSSGAELKLRFVLRMTY